MRGRNMLTCISNGIWLVAPRVPRYPYANCLYIEDERPTVIDLGAGGNAFADGDEIQTGKNTIKAIHLPGHSAGHYGFYFEKENILFSADIDLVRTVPWYNSNSGNVGDLIAAYKAKIYAYLQCAHTIAELAAYRLTYP